ncbi:hypothetical protein D3C76_1656370 [compost metagenome]
MKADLDLCNPPHADLIQTFADVGVAGAELADFANELLQASGVHLQGDGLTASSDHERISLTL